MSTKTEVSPSVAARRERAMATVAETTRELTRLRERQHDLASERGEAMEALQGLGVSFREMSDLCGVSPQTLQRGYARHLQER